MVEKIYVHVMMVECYVMKRVLGIKIGCREISIPKENIEFFNFHRFRHHKCMPWARKGWQKRVDAVKQIILLGFPVSGYLKLQVVSQPTPRPWTNICRSFFPAPRRGIYNLLLLHQFVSTMYNIVLRCVINLLRYYNHWCGRGLACLV